MPTNTSIASGRRLGVSARRCRKFGVLVTLAPVAAVVFGAAVASAHVDPDPIAVQAGVAATIGFKVEHGCSGSPTNALKIQLPSTIVDAKPVDKPGWTAAVAGNVVSFTGGKLDAATGDHFDISFTAPKEAGEAVFNIVQTCDKGSISWIEPIVDGKPEPVHPAAVLKITAGLPTAAELTPAVDAPVADTKSSSSSKVGWIIGGGAVVVVAMAGGLVMRRRKPAAPAS